MKVLLTGATGLLGGHLLQSLQARGEHIRALVLPVENAQKLIAQDHGSFVAEQLANITHTKPLVTPLGVMMFGSDNRHSIDKARSELGYAPQVDLREGIRLAAAWFNAGGMEQPLVQPAIQVAQHAPLEGAQKS